MRHAPAPFIEFNYPITEPWMQKAIDILRSFVTDPEKRKELLEEAAYWEEYYKNLPPETED
jgi:hypothetical protein